MAFNWLLYKPDVISCSIYVPDYLVTGQLLLKKPNNCLYRTFFVNTRIGNSPFFSTLISKFIFKSFWESIRPLTAEPPILERYFQSSTFFFEFLDCLISSMNHGIEYALQRLLISYIDDHVNTPIPTLVQLFIPLDYQCFCLFIIVPFGRIRLQNMILGLSVGLIELSGSL